MAAVSGVSSSTLYRLLARLVKDGELQTQTLPTDRSGYALSNASAAQTDHASAGDNRPPSDTD